MEPKYKKPAPRGVAFGVTVDDDGHFQLVKFTVTGKSTHSHEVIRDDLTRYDIRHQFEAHIRRFFHDFDATKLQ